MKGVGVVIQKNLLILLLFCLPCWALLLNFSNIMLLFHQKDLVVRSIDVTHFIIYTCMLFIIASTVCDMCLQPFECPLFENPPELPTFTWLRIYQLFRWGQCLLCTNAPYWCQKKANVKYSQLQNTEQMTGLQLIKKKSWSLLLFFTQAVLLRELQNSYLQNQVSEQRASHFTCFSLTLSFQSCLKQIKVLVFNDIIVAMANDIPVRIRSSISSVHNAFKLMKNPLIL